MSRSRAKVLIVFGEDDSDRSALVELVKAIKPETNNLKFHKIRNPLVLLRNTENLKTRKTTATKISSVVKAIQCVSDVVAVVAHRDCDDFEPAHETVAASIETELSAVGVHNVIAATPASAIEAWWMLFPEPVASVRSCWARIDLSGQDVGQIAKPKDELRRRLRPTDPSKRRACPDYAESDGIKIAFEIRIQNRILQPIGRSQSFTRFKERVSQIRV